MANIKATNNDYARFYIESEVYGKILMDIEPGGWNDDNLELDRDINHGIFNKFSNSLEFYKKYKNIIEDTFKQKGNNSSLFLIKEELMKKDGKIKFVEIYRGRADWETKNIKDNILSIKFNSNDIESLIKANETDELELETRTTIDDIPMDEMQLSKTSIKGRDLYSSSESAIIDEDRNKWLYLGSYWSTFGPVMKTKILSRGFDRHSSVDVNIIQDIEASTMFFVDSTAEEIDQDIELKLSLDFDYFYAYFDNTTGQDTLDTVTFKVELLKVKREEVSPGINDYSVIERNELYRDDSAEFRKSRSYFEPETVNDYLTHASDYSLNTTVKFDEGLILLFNFDAPYYPPSLKRCLRFRKHKISFTSISQVEPSLDLSCSFVHDAYSRLINIIANDSDLFYSKYFGRKEIGYDEDGECGLIGLINGYMIRAFDRNSEKYKGLQISFKDLVDSTNAMFNVGMGIETIKNKKKIRVEEVKYFYQNQTIIHLGETTDLERSYDKELYFSGLEFGQNKGGEYDNETGLDEPNIENRYITPDRKSDKKYRKISKIRSDETEMEILRRKPQYEFPEEGFGSDSDIWFLDLKRDLNNKFTQKDWFDRLKELPKNIISPSTYRAFFFTPLRMMFRHSWIITSGLQPYINKKIKFASSKSNSNLSTLFKNEDSAYREDLPNGIEVGVLSRPRVLPETVTFRAKVSRDIFTKIYGTTRVFYKGSWENIPNYYFKFSWIDENGNLEKGYLMNMKPENLGTFTMQKSNE